MMLSVNLGGIALGNITAATLGKYPRVQQMMYVTFKCITTGIDITAMTSTLLPI